MTIEAAILSLQHSFIVDNWGCGEKLTKLNVFGAIAQRYRGPVGTGGASALATGYPKNYNYDDRLKFRSPPYFLDPVAANWKVLRTNEQVPAVEVAVSPRPPSRTGARRVRGAAGARRAARGATRLAPAGDGRGRMRCASRPLGWSSSTTGRCSRSPLPLGVARARHRRSGPAGVDHVGAGCPCCAGSPGPPSCRARRASRAGSGPAAAAARCRRSQRRTRPTARCCSPSRSPASGEPQLRAGVGRGARRALAARRAGRARAADARGRHARRAEVFRRYGIARPLTDREVPAGDAALAADRRPADPAIRRSGEDPRAATSVAPPGMG